jgi:hypothetical protein
MIQLRRDQDKPYLLIRALRQLFHRRAQLTLAPLDGGMNAPDRRNPFNGSELKANHMYQSVHIATNTSWATRQPARAASGSPLAFRDD